MDGSFDPSTSPRPRIVDLFSTAQLDGRPLHVCAPMVRYSKLPFRLLLRSYDVDVTYTPMILAHEFVRSAVARDSDFTTSALEQNGISLTRENNDAGAKHVLIAQFAASEPEEFARAADLISPWVDGVDLNCGCPQSWAVKEGIGCSLMSQPELVAQMVRAAKERLARKGRSVSVKIRIHKDLAETIRWVQIVEDAGVDFITVHGRLKSQRSSTPPNYEAIRRVKEAVRVPVVANGDAYTLADVRDIVGRTKADGVMAARGLLENPTLFAGSNVPSPQSVRELVEHVVRCPIPFPLILHHVTEMTARMEGSGKKERRRLMACEDMVDLIDYIEEKFPP